MSSSKLTLHKKFVFVSVLTYLGKLTCLKYKGKINDLNHT